MKNRGSDPTVIFGWALVVWLLALAAGVAVELLDGCAVCTPPRMPRPDQCVGLAPFDPKCALDPACDDRKIADAGPK